MTKKERLGGTLLLAGGEAVAASSRRPYVNEPATEGPPDALKKLSADERRSSSKIL